MVEDFETIEESSKATHLAIPARPEAAPAAARPASAPIQFGRREGQLRPIVSSPASSPVSVRTIHVQPKPAMPNPVAADESVRIYIPSDEIPEVSDLVDSSSPASLQNDSINGVVDEAAAERVGLRRRFFGQGE
jgi:hypothetical protein